MKKLLLAASGMLTLSLAFLGAAPAHGPGPVHPSTGRVIKIEARSTADLTIVHIVRGCHNWTDGSRLADRAEVAIHRSGRLTILNQDVDLHRVVELSGPRIATGSKMKMNTSVRLNSSRAVSTASRR